MESLEGTSPKGDLRGGAAPRSERRIHIDVDPWELLGVFRLRLDPCEVVNQVHSLFLREHALSVLLLNSVNLVVLFLYHKIKQLRWVKKKRVLLHCTHRQTWPEVQSEDFFLTSLKWRLSVAFGFVNSPAVLKT